MRKRQVVVRRSTSSSEDHHQGSRVAAVAIRSVTRYGECQKNHAAGVGGYAVDGCREFMASGEEGTAAALTCAACGCHRNFHRREVDNHHTSHHHHEVVSECSSPSNSSNGA